MEDNIKYEDAVKELESIVRRMESDELDVDSLTTQLRRAQELVRLCKDRLTRTDEQIKRMLADDSAAPVL